MSAPNDEQAGGSQQRVELEETDQYLRRTVAEIRRARFRTADRVASTLVFAVVGSLPLYVLAAALAGTIEKDGLERIFDKWYDVVSPLLGAAIGALFGIAIANPNRRNGNDA